MSRDIPELLEGAATRGFVSHFEFKTDTLICRETGKCYAAQRLKLVEMLQPDPGSDPGGEATLYLLEAEGGEKGMLLIGNPATLSAQERSVLALICNKSST